MSGRLHRLSLVALGVCLGLLLAAGGALAFNKALLADLFGPGLVRAQVVIYANGQDSEIYFSRGKIIAVNPGLTLREKDGQVEHFDVAPGARITLGGTFVALSSLRRGMQAQVFRAGGDAPASRIDATVR